MLDVKVWRDCDKWRLRKVVLVCRDKDGKMLDKCRMFAGPGFARRLAKKIARMLKRAEIMKAAWQDAK